MFMIRPEISGFPGPEDIKNFLLAGIVTGMSFAAFFGSFDVFGVLRYTFLSFLVLLARETGVRMVVYKLDGYVDLLLSKEGASTSLVTAIGAAVTGLPLLALFPVETSVSRKAYENWGKSVDVIWARYEFYISAVAVLVPLITGFLTLGFGFDRLAHVSGLFCLFQMMPFDYRSIPTGKLDGADIIRWSGFYWLFLTGTSILLIALSL